jgi:hypothetical protein
MNEAPIKAEDKICKCGHSLARHRRAREKHPCIERFCPCGDFTLNNIK